MITVIDNYNEGSLEMYEGMSLQEATAQFVLESSQLVNDFMMDLLLTEHAYLVENGHEIEYTTLGEANDNGLSFLDKVNNLIQNAKTLFLKIVNNIIAFITEKSTQVIAWFKKMGMDEAKVKKAFGQPEYAGEKINICSGLLGGEGLKEITSQADVFFNKSVDAISEDDIPASGDMLEMADHILEEKEVPASEAGAGVIEMIFHSKKVIDNIKKHYKSATDSLERLKKRKAASKSMDADKINETLTLIRAAIMGNTYVMKDISKIYSQLMKSALNAARDMVKLGKPEKKENTEVAAKKEELAAAKAEKKEQKAAEKDQKKVAKLQAQINKTKGADEETDDAGQIKGCDRSQKLREACELVLEALAESDEEESQYDGKFFRV